MKNLLMIFVAHFLIDNNYEIRCATIDGSEPTIRLDVFNNESGEIGYIIIDYLGNTVSEIMRTFSDTRMNCIAHICTVHSGVSFTYLTGDEKC